MSMAGVPGRTGDLVLSSYSCLFLFEDGLYLPCTWTRWQESPDSHLLCVILNPLDTQYTNPRWPESCAFHDHTLSLAIGIGSSCIVHAACSERKYKNKSKEEPPGRRAFSEPLVEYFTHSQCSKADEEPRLARPK